MLSRRTFLSRTGLAAATASALGAPHIARSAAQLATAPGQKPKRIIHLVSDGMSEGTLTCADRFSKMTRKRPLAWMQLMAVPGAYRAMVNTRSLNSMVTDSAAASCAWGSGSLVVNGAINVLPDGRKLTPLYSLFADKGWARGLVTTAELTHATPAGFATSTKSRNNAAEIAVQYLDQKVEVLLGGGRPFFDGKNRKDKRDLRGDFARAGYSVVKDSAELEKAPLNARLFGTFADGHLPYTIDHVADPRLKGSVPTIARMTAAALARLERHEHFILQVEGARVDHAAHNSDAAAAIHDQIAFDEAIDVCLAFQNRHPDTLVILTTDHANSNLGLNGMGGGYRHSSQRFAALGEIRMSYPEILKRLQKVGEKIKVSAIPNDREEKLEIADPMAKVTPPPAAGTEGDEEAEQTRFTGAVQMASALRIEPKAIVDIIADTTGYTMSARRAELFARVLGGDYQALYDQMNSPITQLGQLMANRIGVGWTGNTHTTDYVPVIAYGPGAELFTGFIQNTDFFAHYTHLAGIDFKNPSVPLIADFGPEPEQVENIAAYAKADAESYV